MDLFKTVKGADGRPRLQALEMIKLKDVTSIDRLDRVNWGRMGADGVWEVTPSANAIRYLSRPDGPTCWCREADGSPVIFKAGDCFCIWVTNGDEKNYANYWIDEKLELLLSTPPSYARKGMGKGKVLDLGTNARGERVNR